MSGLIQWLKNIFNPPAPAPLVAGATDAQLTQWAATLNTASSSLTATVGQ